MKKARKENSRIIDYVLLGLGSSEGSGYLDFITILDPAEIEKLLINFAKIKGISGCVPSSIRSEIAGKIALVEKQEKQKLEKYKDLTQRIYDTWSIEQKKEYCQWLIKQVKWGFGRFDDFQPINLESWNGLEFVHEAYLNEIIPILHRIKPEEV